MSRSNEFKEQGSACRCSVTDSQFGDLAAFLPSPVELVSLAFACPLPRCEIERNAGSCRADPTRSARWPARVNLAAFWQQIAPIVPFLPTLPTAKYCPVCYLQIAAHLDTEEVAGSNPVVPTIFIDTYYSSFPFSNQCGSSDGPLAGHGSVRPGLEDRIGCASGAG